MMDRDRIRAASLELESVLKLFSNVPIIRSIDGDQIRKLIQMGIDGNINEKYNGPFPWTYGFADGWYTDYPEFESAITRFQVSVTRDVDDLMLYDLMIENMKRDT